MLEEFLTSEAIHGETWSKYQHLIAEERRMEEPSCPDDQEALFQEMRSLQNFVGKGPLVKLMRWFSFFECCATWEGEFWATKMIMEYGLDKEGDALEGNPEEDVKEKIEEPTYIVTNVWGYTLDTRGFFLRVGID